MSTISSVRSRLDTAHLYAVTHDSDPDRVEALVEAWMAGGADVVQLRHKTLARGALLDLARRLVPIVHHGGGLLIVNDYVDLALLAGADGVHLGDDDLSVGSARSIGGRDLLIGASASTPPAALRKVAEGADYVGSGPAFSTPLKPEKRVIGPEGVAAVASAVEVPVFAIGGIDEAAIPFLVAAGVRRASAIRALAETDDPVAAVRRMREALLA